MKLLTEAEQDARIVDVLTDFIQQEVGVGHSELIRVQARELLDHMRANGLTVKVTLRPVE